MLLSFVSAGAKIIVVENVNRIYFVYVYAKCDFETIALFHRKIIVLFSSVWCNVK